MTTEEIIKGNVIIDLFMGAVIDNSFPDKDKVYRLGGRIELDTTLKYHQSWDLLMIAYEKVSCVWVSLSRGEQKSIEGTFRAIQNRILLCNINDSFNLITEFIEWYNKQQKS